MIPSKQVSLYARAHQAENTHEVDVQVFGETPVSRSTANNNLAPSRFFDGFSGEPKTTCSRWSSWRTVRASTSTGNGTTPCRGTRLKWTREAAARPWSEPRVTGRFAAGRRWASWTFTRPLRVTGTPTVWRAPGEWVARGPPGLSAVRLRKRVPVGWEDVRGCGD